MKSTFFIFLFLVSSIGFSQKNHIVKTEDGRRVLLKADFTWEYIDLEVPKTKTGTKEVQETTEKEAPKVIANNECKLPDDFVEPKLESKIQNQLKKGRATITHVKKKVAKDNDCEVDDVTLLSVSETKAKGTYHFCANGTKVIYKRNGHSIAKKINLF